jgi:hypothetical protein
LPPESELLRAKEASIVATILLVEDAPDLGTFEARLLEESGHTVLRCSGGRTPFEPCSMLRDGACALADSADLIIFSCGLFAPMMHRTYGAINVLRAYRQHAVYGRLPMLIVSVGMPDGLGGTGPIEHVDKFADPARVLRSVARLLDRLPAVT